MRRKSSIHGKTRACIEVLEPRRLLSAATGGPDLVLSIVHEVGPAVWVPGSPIGLKIRVTNQGNEIAEGNLLFSYDLTPGPQEEGSPIQLGDQHGDRIHLKLAPGRSIVVKRVVIGSAFFGDANFGLPGVGAKADHLLVSLPSVYPSSSIFGLTIPETNTANNWTSGARTYATAVEFGTVGGQRGVAIIGADIGGSGYHYADGTPAFANGDSDFKFRLLGPGIGRVSADGGDVLLTGTTKRSRLIIRDFQTTYIAGEGEGALVLPLPPYHLHAVIDPDQLGAIILHHVALDAGLLNR